MSELTDFDRGQIVGAQLAGQSVKQTTQLCNVSSRTVLKVMAAHNAHGHTLSAKKSGGHKPGRRRTRRTQAANANGEAVGGKPGCEVHNQNPDEDSKRPEPRTKDKESL